MMGRLAFLFLTLAFSFGLVGCLGGDSNSSSDPDQSFGPEAPSDRYSVQADSDVIVDTVTGHKWKRCAEGQHWESSTESCAGEAEYFTSAEARDLGEKEDDWELPRIEHLGDIVYCSSGEPFLIGIDRFGNSCLGDFKTPTIVSEVFPDTPPSSFWAKDNKIIMFDFGLIADDSPENHNHVRLFRRNMEYLNRYDISDAGREVVDTETGLTWSRCTFGQQWDEEDESCVGNPELLTWLEVDDLDVPEGWRVPKPEELVTIAYCSSADPFQFGSEDQSAGCREPHETPLIVDSVFPETLATGYWTNERFPEPTVSGPTAYLVQFGVAGHITNSEITNRRPVRLVGDDSA